jgi:hypothetical protein
VLNYLLLIGGLLLVWVLLPLLPAVLIYWLFPNTTVTANGPFANLTVATSGAFAAFLIVLAGIGPFVYSIRDGVLDQQKHDDKLKLMAGKQYWTVEVPVKLLDVEQKQITNAFAIQSHLNSNTLQVDTNPRSNSVGSAKITLRIVTPTPGEFPMVIFKLANFETYALDLSDQNPETFDVKPESFWIGVKKPITIRFAPQKEAQRLSVGIPSTDEKLAK